MLWRSQSFLYGVPVSAKQEVGYCKAVACFDSDFSHSTVFAMFSQFCLSLFDIRVSGIWSSITSMGVKCAKDAHFCSSRILWHLGNQFSHSCTKHLCWSIERENVSLSYKYCTFQIVFMYFFAPIKNVTKCLIQEISLLVMYFLSDVIINKNHIMWSILKKSASIRPQGHFVQILCGR